MTDNEYDLITHCIETEEYLTVKILDHYLLFHKNVLENQIDLGKNNYFLFVKISLILFFKNFLQILFKKF